MIPPQSQQFVDSILALRPRVAAFDCDGTLWDADSGMEFFYWIVERGLVDKQTAAWALPRYDDYKAGKVDEKTMCGEMVQICRGLRVADIREAAQTYFHQKVEPVIFPEMLALTRALRDQGCHLWAVSSSNQWLIETEAATFGFSASHVLASAAAEEGAIATEQLLRVPTGADKATVLLEHLRVPLDAAFGNSVHDVGMLELAARAFAINPNPDLETIARERRWPVFHPAPLRNTLTRS
jgi:phosphoserine phosphatase